MATDADTRRGSQRRATEDGGCGQRPGGRRSAPQEDVGSRCYIEVLQLQMNADES